MTHSWIIKPHGDNVWLFDEARAQLALEVVNRRVAGIYRQEPLPTMFIFVQLLDRREVLQPSGKVLVVSEALGDCNHETGIIRLVIRKGWQATAIHELVHRYNRGRREAWVRRAAVDVGRLLKQGAIWSEPANSLPLEAS